MQISTLIGTQILSPAGENLGYVKDVLLTRDMKAISCLVAVDGEEEEFYLPARAILSAKDAVIAGRARLPAPTGIKSPLGRAVFSEEGEFLGAVADLTLADAPALSVAKDGATQIVESSRAAVGETVIVYRNAKPSAKKRTAKEKKSAPPAETERAPASSFGFNRFNLIGRRVKRTVFDDAGMPVAIAGERVTPDTLARARRENRLLALTVNTLTNLP